MRVTQTLWRQHIGWNFKQQWKVQRHRVPLATGADLVLSQMNIPVVPAEDIVAAPCPMRIFFTHNCTNNTCLSKVFSVQLCSSTKLITTEMVDVWVDNILIFIVFITKKELKFVGLADRPLPWDECHPLYHKQECHMFGNHSVLLKGLDQAKVLTNTVELEQGLPAALPRVTASARHHHLVNNLALDAEQKKLPKLKDPERPAFNFPRVYGITDIRGTRLLTYRLIQLCASISGSPRPVVNHTPVKVTMDRGGSLVQLGIRADQLLVAKTPLSPLVDQYSTSGMELPGLGQAHFTVSLETDHFYQDIDIYPTGNWAPHTLVLHGNQSEVYNLYETPVTEQQWLGRSLVGSFIVAAAYARAQFGAGVEDLPHPVCVQCCHTDGRLFHFVILQLNTLGVGTELRNILWSQPRVALFDTCGYKNGQPELTGYNGDVLDTLLSLYTHSITS
uniref:Large ribosomal subunit protein mL37 n=1 Tax=Timema poppense TaxID=170557 RepID=A0A7R9H4M8_TIMPO|nr:unnamed protein product [Timema poppensis]